MIYRGHLLTQKQKYIFEVYEFFERYTSSFELQSKLFSLVSTTILP